MHRNDMMKELRADFQKSMEQATKEAMRSIMPKIAAAAAKEAAPVLATALIQDCIGDMVKPVQAKQAKQARTTKRKPFNPDEVSWKDGSVIISIEEETAYTAKASTVNAANGITAYVCKVEGRTKTLRKCGLEFIKGLPEVFTLYQPSDDGKKVYTVYGFITKSSVPKTGKDGWTKNGGKIQKLLNVSAAEQHDIWLK